MDSSGFYNTGLCEVVVHVQKTCGICRIFLSGLPYLVKKHFPVDTTLFQTTELLFQYAQVTRWSALYHNCFLIHSAYLQVGAFSGGSMHSDASLSVSLPGASCQVSYLGMGWTESAAANVPSKHDSLTQPHLNKPAISL